MIRKKILIHFMSVSFLFLECKAQFFAGKFRKFPDVSGDGIVIGNKLQVKVDMSIS